MSISYNANNNESDYWLLEYDCFLILKQVNIWFASFSIISIFSNVINDKNLFSSDRLLKFLQDFSMYENNISRSLEDFWNFTKKWFLSSTSLAWQYLQNLSSDFIFLYLPLSVANWCASILNWLKHFLTSLFWIRRKTTTTTKKKKKKKKKNVFPITRPTLSQPPGPGLFISK